MELALLEFMVIPLRIIVFSSDNRCSPSGALNNPPEEKTLDKTLIINLPFTIK
jgi:hypothetical protein